MTRLVEQSLASGLGRCGAGNTLLPDGGFENSRMTLSDRDTPGKPDRGVINEIIWTPNADGSVRQRWRTSADGGKTWQTAFDGPYVNSSRPQPSRLLLTAKPVS